MKVYYKEDYPIEAIKDCTKPGPADEAVSFWVKKLGFKVNVSDAREFMGDTGAWTDEELAAKSDLDVTEAIFWIMCGAFETDDVFSLEG